MISSKESQGPEILDRAVSHVLNATVFNQSISMKTRRAVVSAALDAVKQVFGPCSGRAPRSLEIRREWSPDNRNEPTADEIAHIRRHEPKNKSFFKEQLFDNVFHYLRHNVDFRNGAWDEDWGDALSWGLPVLFKYAEMTGSQQVEKMARATAGHCRSVLEQNRRRPIATLRNAEHVMMSAAALMESGKYAHARGDADLVCGAVDFFSKLSAVSGHIIEIDLGAVLQDCYGTVLPAAAMAMLDLSAHDYLSSMGDERADYYLEAAREAMDAIAQKAWDASKNRYIFRPDDQRDFVYPNPVMLLAHLSLCEKPGGRKHLDRALSLLEYIDGFRDTDRGGFFTPYFRLWTHGQYGRKYKSLSAHNYMALAFLELHRITGDAGYLARFRELFEFIERDLYYDGLVWHDWNPDTGRSDMNSYEPYCAGCNFLVLYVLMKANYDYELGEQLLSL